ncbi:MAG: YqaA family protein [Paracoccaceae bacterium]
MFRRLYNWTMEWAGSRHAPKALGAVSFVESSFFPIPADVLFIPMCLARRDLVYRYALIASVTSVLGGIFGWMLGYYFFDMIAQPMLAAMGKLDTFNKLREGISWEMILLMLVTSGASHIPPMKVVTILSGVVAFDLKWFILSAIVARSARFYGLAWALNRFGPHIAEFIEKRLAWVATGLLVALGALYFITRAH